MSPCQPGKAVCAVAESRYSRGWHSSLADGDGERKTHVRTGLCNGPLG